MVSTASQLPAIAPDDLVLLICRHGGTVTHGELRAARYSDASIADWVRQDVLLRDSSNHYRLVDPDVYIDWLIQALWLVPDGIIGHLTALEYHGISVAWLRAVDVGVCHPQPAMEQIHLFQVPAPLWQYGVTEVYPSLPGAIAIPMYSPPVALAQVLADPACDLESAADALIRYVGEHGIDPALHAAADRYGVSERLKDLLHPQV